MTIRAVGLEEGRDAILENLLRLRLQRREILLFRLRSYRGHGRGQCQGNAHKGQRQQATAKSSGGTVGILLFGRRDACEAATDAEDIIASSVTWAWVQGWGPWLAEHFGFEGRATNNADNEPGVIMR